MRAVYLKEIPKNDEVITIEDSPFHHLKNVCRVKLGDDVLLINGDGLRVFSNIAEINKKDIKLTITKRVQDKFEEKSTCVFGKKRCS